MKFLIRKVLNTVPRKYIQKVAPVTTKIAGLFYWGNKVECPVCKHHYKKFLPYGYVHVRKNALCPNCLSLERHRLLWLYLMRETDFFVRTQKILHLAPEYCFIRRFRKVHKADYVTADLESPLADVHCNVQQMPFQDNSFDVVICNHLLEHVDNDFEALSEIFRVLKSGGYAVLLSPVNRQREITYEDATITSPEERSKHFGQKDHLREYGLDYPQRIESIGFKVYQEDYLTQINHSEKYGLISEILYIAKKG